MEKKQTNKTSRTTKVELFERLILLIDFNFRQSNDNSVSWAWKRKNPRNKFNFILLPIHGLLYLLSNSWRVTRVFHQQRRHFCYWQQTFKFFFNFFFYFLINFCPILASCGFCSAYHFEKPKLVTSLKRKFSSSLLLQSSRARIAWKIFKC